MSELDRRHYRLLIEIARRGTLSAAARTLHVTQSAASQQLHEAERRFGYPLTHRIGRSIGLTAAAQRLVASATISEQLLDNAESDARWLATGARSACRVALGVYDNVSWVSAVQAELDALDECAPIELIRAPGPYGFELLDSGAAHVVIAPSERPVPGRRTVHLFDDTLVGVVAADHPLAGRESLVPADFDGVRYVAFSTTPEEGFENDTFLRPSRKAPREILRIESTTAILDLVATSDRVTILSNSVADGHPGVRLVPLDPVPPPVRWSMSFSAEGLDPSVRSTVERVIEWWSTS